MSKLLTGALTFAVLAFASLPGWATIIETGNGFPIPNDSTNLSTILVMDDLRVESLFISLDIEHTWVGDLEIQLTGPGGTLDIMMRNGWVGTGDGDGSDLKGVYKFEDGGGDIWQAACDTEVQNPIAPGTYAAGSFSEITTKCEPGTGNSPHAKPTFFSMFQNTSTKGNWTLSITDVLAPDAGNLNSWTLQIATCDHTIDPDCDNTIPTPTPIPGTLLLLLTGLAGIRAGRRTRG